jgi:HAD superfamily hydrolase (TIGR01484 family)
MKLLCTDLDRTLLPNGVQTESEHARPILWHLLRSFGLALAYVSGRDLNRVLEAITDYELPVPDYIVADVGASIYIHGNGGWQACSNWQSVLSRQWRGHDSRYISTFLSEFGALKLQESDRQTPFKCSYYYDQAHDEASLRDMILTRLRDEDMSAELIFSHDPEKNLGLLDILPGSANKREPVAYLQNLAELADHDVLFAGDSGNDVAAVLAPHPSVLVANADAHTQREVLLRNSRSTHPESTYLAKGGLEVADHEALNGYYAAGIVEGLVYFRPVWKECLGDSRWVQNALAQKSR